MPNAIITGATQGIGKAIADKLLANGCAIAICARNEDKLLAVQQEWNERYPTASILALTADVSNKDEVTIFANAVLSTFGTVDLLVNNAGAFMPGHIADDADGQLEQMMRTNLYGPYNLSRAIVPAMKANGSGHIFNVCSVASLKAYPGSGSYSVSKYALLGLTDNLREELREHYIKVTALCPGATYSASWEGSGIDPARILDAKDVADTLWAAYNLSPQAGIDTIVMRPVKGDL